MSSREEITRLLSAASDGNREALDALVPLVYDELYRVAQRQMRAEATGITLSATGLVHEVYLRLADQERIEWHDREHFFAVASVFMRRILVNAAKKRRRVKRGGGAANLALDAAGDVPGEMADEQILALDEALARLAEINARAAKVVECRYFGGLTIEETSAALGVGAMTVKRDWLVAKAWLKRELAA